MQTIDLESIIKYKTNRKIPKFIARLVKKIICLDRINEIIIKYGKDNQSITFTEKVLEDLNITTSIKGLENIPRNEKTDIRIQSPARGSRSIGYRQVSRHFVQGANKLHYQRNTDLHTASKRYIYTGRGRL